MRFSGVLNYVRTHLRAKLEVPTAFERQSKESDGMQIAFEVHYGSFKVHSGHSGRIWSGLPFDSPLNVIRIFLIMLECRNGPLEYQCAIRKHFECR